MAEHMSLTDDKGENLAHRAIQQWGVSAQTYKHGYDMCEKSDMNKIHLNLGTFYNLMDTEYKHVKEMPNHWQALDCTEKL